jgi:hypothetical protein
MHEREGFKFSRVGSILLLFACLGLVGGGLVRILRESAENSIAWIMLAGGFLLTFVSVNQWGRILPGVFGLAGVNAVITLWSGHQINQPNVLVPRGSGISSCCRIFLGSSSIWPDSSTRVQRRPQGFAAYGFRTAAACNDRESVCDPWSRRSRSMPVRPVAATAPHHRDRPQSHP